MSERVEQHESDVVRVLLCTFALATASFANMLLVPIAMHGAGSSEEWIGVVVGAFSFALVGGRLSSGWAIDHWGGRRFLFWGAIVIALTSPLMGLSSAPGVLLACRIVQGVAAAAFTTAGVALVAEWAGPAERAQAMGRWWIAWSGAAILGPAIAGWISRDHGTGAAFLASGIFAAVSGVLVPLRGPRVVQPRAERPVIRLYARCALLPSIIGVMVGFAGGAFATYAPLHALDLKLHNPGVYLSLFAVGIIPGQYVFTLLTARHGRSRGLVPALAAGIFVCIGIGAAHTIPVALTCSFLFGATNSGISPVLSAWAVDRAAPEERATATSTSIASRELGSFLGALALGFTMGPWTPFGSWLLVGAVFALGLAVYLVYGREAPRTVEVPQT